jgi:hypothetical protein
MPCRDISDNRSNALTENLVQVTVINIDTGTLMFLFNLLKIFPCSYLFLDKHYEAHLKPMFYRGKNSWVLKDTLSSC